MSTQFTKFNLKTLSWHGLASLVFISACNTAGEDEKKQTTGNDTQPNVIVILADDMGYSDLGCYGSEIKTPNLDKLANEGLIMTNFYNAARSCPSRASLLTGLYPHRAGMGGMADTEHSVMEYQGYLSDNSITIGEVLQQAGYRTYTSGKWHVGHKRPYWPCNQGFDRSYTLLNGASSYFNIEPYRDSAWLNIVASREVHMVEDSNFYQPPEEGFYMTDAFTDYAVQFLEKDKQSDKPFFLYLAYTAPHWPLHALPEDIKKYEGIYDVGWDRIREQRYKKMIESGIIDNDTKLSPRMEHVKPWNELSEEEKQLNSRKMQVYAAMIDRMDQNIGKLIDKLKELGEYENTMIMFLSDNGACKAAGVGFTENYDKSGPIGSEKSFTAYGPGWANVGNTPFRYFKANVYEGGIATPFIVHYPEFIKPGTQSNTVGHVFDIMPTILELTDADYPEKFKGHEISPMDGISLLSTFKGQETTRQRDLFWEHSGNEAARNGFWKLVRMRKDTAWNLYDLNADPVELNNLAQEKPELYQEMIEKYNNWADEYNIIHIDSLDNYKQYKGKK